MEVVLQSALCTRVLLHIRGAYASFEGRSSPAQPPRLPSMAFASTRNTGRAPERSNTSDATSRDVEMRDIEMGAGPRSQREEDPW